MDKIIETKTCKQCSSHFDITQNDLDFYDKISPVFGGKKYQIPAPTLCPECRQQRRLSFRNERNLYKRKCDATGKSIISSYSPDKKNKVYHHDIWWSDSWNPFDYGRELSFQGSVFEEFGKMLQDIPRPNLWIRPDLENCEYCNFGVSSNQCYMTVSPFHSEKCLYSNTPINCTYDIDGYFNTSSENTYECIHCNHCYKVFYSQYCTDCTDSYFLKDCIGCSSCIGCVNLKNKEYYILNRAYTKENFIRKKRSILNDNNSLNSFQKQYQNLINNEISLGYHHTNTEDSTGEFLVSTGNVNESIQCIELENSKYCQICGANSTYIYDSTNSGMQSHLLIETLGNVLQHNSGFSILCSRSKNIWYSVELFSCNNCFLCIGLKNKEYCILNKQYTEKEYEETVAQIIQYMIQLREWGEFLPISVSSFSYNETVAQEIYPLLKEQIEKIGGTWSDYTAPFPKVEKVLPAKKLPQNINDIPDDILNWAIECEVTKKPFRIVSQELNFYRKHKFPIPKRHPDQRYLDRLSLKSGRKIYERVCDNCSKNIKTTYALETPEKVYCEDCYNQEIYG